MLKGVSIIFSFFYLLIREPCIMYLTHLFVMRAEKCQGHIHRAIQEQLMELRSTIFNLQQQHPDPSTTSTTTQASSGLNPSRNLFANKVVFLVFVAVHISFDVFFSWNHESSMKQ